MTLKQMAALNVAKFIGVAALGGILVNIMIHFLGQAWTGTIMAGVILIYMIRMVYQIEVDRLQRLNSLTKIKESGQ